MGDSEYYDGIGIYAAAGGSGPESTGVFQQGQAHSLGFLDGLSAARSGGPRKPRRQHPRLRRPLADGEWDEYRRGWDEAAAEVAVTESETGEKEIMTTYTAAIATESGVVSGDYCDVAVIINDDSQPEPQLGSELALDPVELNVRTDDPDKLVKVEIAAETALLMRRWRVTGKWEVAGNALYAPVTKTGEAPS